MAGVDGGLSGKSDGEDQLARLQRRLTLGCCAGQGVQCLKRDVSGAVGTFNLDNRV